ncbi:DMT family transporter [Clostridium grantii]|uniref:Transporter family-2 protein n=1 Tax=Clostridium grantii DSM 8605 TaxID=1121316 RepID=A0A1M5W5K9_9CLOT|nr:DMT family transporter [Clostridium grantii]SHH82718.1 transporter family-2 protein [Clostridium grantii DSM 8605]
MFGLISSIIAGISMSFQGVFNTRLSEKIGLWQTNFLVQAIAFLITGLILLFVGKGNLSNLGSSNKLYLLGGPLSVIIIFTVMGGIETLGPTYSISTILVSQLLAAGVIDAFGLFGSEKVYFGSTKIMGLLIMILGIIIFKWKR